MTRRKPSTIRVDGDAAYVTLTRGLEAVIDAVDVPLVQEYRWHSFLGVHGHAYAYSSIGRKAVAMHRLILTTPSGMVVDHVDGNGLNNRRCNIRNCTAAENQANRGADRRNITKIKGVSPVESGKYCAVITPNGRKINLGRFVTPEEAAAAYQGAARILWGDFAKK